MIVLIIGMTAGWGVFLLAAYLLDPQARPTTVRVQTVQARPMPMAPLRPTLDVVQARADRRAGLGRRIGGAR